MRHKRFAVVHIMLFHSAQHHRVTTVTLDHDYNIDATKSNSIQLKATHAMKAIGQSQWCIIRLTCSHRELTKDHVLTSAYVIIF